MIQILEDFYNVFNFIEFCYSLGSKVKEVFLMKNSDGRPAGECYCQFEDEEDVQKAKNKDQENMGKRYIEGLMYLIFYIFFKKKN